MNCAIGFYNTNSGACKPCTNKPQSNAQYTTNSDATTPNSCAWTCLLGFYKTPDACVPCSTGDCPVGRYRTQCTATADSSCTPCTNDKPANSIYSSSGSPHGSNNCAWACANGFYKSGAGCAACSTASCPVGQYRGACAADVDSVCQPCTVADKSNSAYTSPGKPFDSNTCQWACNTGYFKSSNLCKACTTAVCSTGQYRGACGAESDGACLPCTAKPANSNFVGAGSPYNTNSCAWACASGFFQSAGTCAACTSTPCSIGQYRSACSASADGKCVPCTNPIPANAAYSSAGNPYDANTCAWVCNAGYFNGGGVCQPCSTAACPAGQYRGRCTQTGDGPCLACTSKPASSNFVGPGSPYNTDSCPWGCVAGYYTTGAACASCTTSACGVGFFRTACGVAADSKCTPCTNPIPANAAYSAASSPYDSNNCAWACNPGYFRSGAACQPCTQTQCPVGQYRAVCTPAQDGACAPCTSWEPEHAEFVSAGSYGVNKCDWSCVAGYFRRDTTCQPCTVGSCPTGQYRTPCAAAADSACAACTNLPPNGVFTSAGNPGAPASCQTSCAAGYVRQADGSCKLCDSSTCQVGQYRGACTVAADGQCGPCTNGPANSVYTGPGQPYGTNTCAWACKSGFYQSAGACVACSTASCPVGQYRGACAANADAPCVVCTVKPSSSAFTSAGAPYNTDTCTWACNPGYYRSGTTCTACTTAACPVGQYRGACTATGDAPCVACTKAPANAAYTSAGSPANTDSCAWAYKSGFYLSAGACVACSTSSCPVGQYRGACAANADAPCAPCTNRPSNSIFTSTGAPYNTDTCTWACVAGYYRATGACTACTTAACPVGQYRGACTATGDAPCVACTKAPANAAYTSAGSPANTDSCAWAYKSGFYLSAGACVACSTSSCPVGQYRGACAANADAPCVPCTGPSNSVFTSAGTPYNTNACAFACLAGFYRAGSSCAACSSPTCPVGQYPTGCAQGAITDSACAACSGPPAGASFTSAGKVRGGGEGVAPCGDGVPCRLRGSACAGWGRGGGVAAVGAARPGPAAGAGVHRGRPKNLLSSFPSVR